MKLNIGKKLLVLAMLIPITACIWDGHRHRGHDDQGRHEGHRDGGRDRHDDDRRGH